MNNRDKDYEIGSLAHRLDNAECNLKLIRETSKNVPGGEIISNALALVELELGRIADEMKEVLEA